MIRFVSVLLTAALAGVVSPPAGAIQQPGPQQILVQFDPLLPGVAADTAVAALGGRTLGRVYGTDVRIVRIPGVSAEAAAARVGALPVVGYAEPDFELSLLLDAPNDLRYGDQYALERISALDGWAHHPGSYTSTGGPTIAIIDTGIDRNHEEFGGRIDTQNSNCFLGLLCVVGGWSDDHGHGTHVAGSAAASTDNGSGIAGVAYDTRIMALKVCNVIGSCSTSAVAGAINWATERGAAVINMSLGGPGDSSTLRNAVRSAWATGVVLVAAAGNDGNTSYSYPAAYDEVVSVAATDGGDEHASFSNRNDDVEVAAPGVGVLSAWPGNRYQSLSGTSMASPHVAGLAALLIGQNPEWSNSQVRSRMSDCADDLGEAGRDDRFGHGRIDLGRALGSC